MASAIIEAVVVKLVEMAVGQVANEASLLLHFREDFEWLQKELTKVTGYLQDADDVYMKKPPVKNWLADLRDIVFDVEDVVEECVVGSESLIFRYKIGRRIRKIKNRVSSIMKDAAELELAHRVVSPTSHTSHNRAVEKWKKSSVVERDARPVAIDAKVEKILHFLEDDVVQLIAVVGMGGMGKTFLLQNVYNYYQVRQRFQEAIWLSVSQVYDIARLQCDIASHLDKDVKEGGVREQRITKLIKEGITEQRTAELIHDKLRDKSVLIVLDDVWKVEDGNNLIERLGIPCSTTKPCKIVVTTRSMEVCNNMGASKIYHMEFLSEQDSWDLFCLHAFPDDQQNRPPQELDEVVHQVERECGRLPLAIKTVAASMASQKVLSTWELKLRQLKEVSDAQDPVRPILRLSYDALPAILKPCFLYFSFFGEDVEIDAEYLICLWIGEGFITGKEEERWSTGWSYLKQLNNLCLVEVSEDVGWERLKTTCKIHDLVLDLIISISKETKCAFRVEGASGVGCRRILLAKKGLDDVGISTLKYYPSLRTLSLSQNSIKKLPTKSLSSVRPLRVIDLSYTNISLLPRCVGNFKLLKVLNLSYTGFGEVPACVRKLNSLCFLNVDGCPVPKWIGDLKCLQHLHVGRVNYSSEISRGISKLVSLRTLRAEYRSLLVLKDVQKLIHLEELQIDIENEEEGRSLEEGVLAQLVNMRRLTVVVHESPTNLTENMKAMKDLEYLQLHKFSVVPRWICEYRNLMVLKLGKCELSEWPALETMPNLINLYIGFCSCKELAESFGKSGAFTRLRSFEIFMCGELEKLAELQHGAMPRVEEFVVKRCGRLQKIPEGFEYLRSLKLLDLSGENGFSGEERERLKEGGEYWNNIKANNPHVTITM